MALLCLMVAFSAGCDDDDNDTGSQTGGGGEPTTPQNWDSVKIERVGEDAQPGNCVVRELTINRDGSWKAELCEGAGSGGTDGSDGDGTDGGDGTGDDTSGGTGGDGNEPIEVTGQLTQKQTNTLNKAIEPLLTDLGEETCQDVTGFSNAEVTLTVDGEETKVVDVNEDENQVCYRGGAEDAQALRELLNDTFDAVEKSVENNPPPSGDDNGGDSGGDTGGDSGGDNGGDSGGDTGDNTGDDNIPGV